MGMVDLLKTYAQLYHQNKNDPEIDIIDQEIQRRIEEIKKEYKAPKETSPE